MVQSLGCRPVANIDDLTPEAMATADRVEEVSTGSTKILKVRMPLRCVWGCVCTCKIRSQTLPFHVCVCILFFNWGPLRQFSGVKHDTRTVSVIVRGSSQLVLAEAERSIHDALCVVRCLVKKKYVVDVVEGEGGGDHGFESFVTWTCVCDVLCVCVCVVVVDDHHNYNSSFSHDLNAGD